MAVREPPLHFVPTEALPTTVWLGSDGTLMYLANLFNIL